MLRTKLPISESYLRESSFNDIIYDWLTDNEHGGTAFLSEVLAMLEEQNMSENAATEAINKAFKDERLYITADYKNKELFFRAI